MQSTMWQTLGNYEYEAAQNYDRNGRPVGGMFYTGWYRCVGGRLADGKWPAWNQNTGEER
jgi:hypothetical protein